MKKQKDYTQNHLQFTYLVGDFGYLEIGLQLENVGRKTGNSRRKGHTVDHNGILGAGWGGAEKGTKIK